MRIPQDFIDTLQARVTISSVIGKYTTIKRQSNGTYKGCCPFHSEKTASFTVTDSKNFYHCFGCKESGNAIGFLMKHLGVPYIEAIKMLASGMGMEIPQPTQRCQQQTTKRDILIDIHHKTAQYYKEQLAKNHAAQQYIAQRHITPALQKKFKIGYAPNDNKLLQHLRQYFADDRLVESGIIGKSNTGLYCRFRGRIMFPIEWSGKIIAFGGRILGEGEPKYLNSPETDIFHKGDILYGLDFAKERAYKEKDIYMVEGYMDVIAMHRAGLTNAVATLGTAATERHLQILWKITDAPTISLDGDIAGKRAMMRVCEKATPYLSPTKTLKFLDMPDGQDPDDIINNHGIKP